jgi:hypothetical protein
MIPSRRRPFHSDNVCSSDYVIVMASGTDAPFTGPMVVFPLTTTSSGSMASGAATLRLRTPMGATSKAPWLIACGTVTVNSTSSKHAVCYQGDWAECKVAACTPVSAAVTATTATILRTRCMVAAYTPVAVVTATRATGSKAKSMVAACTPIPVVGHSFL